MKHILWGAGIGLGFPLLFVAIIWVIQFVSMVLAPGPEGPNWIGCLVMMLWTLIFATPFLVLGAIIGAVAGAGVGAVASRGRASRRGNEEDEPGDTADIGPNDDP